MLKLPNIKELEIISEKRASSVNRNLATTESILKRLLINIEAFKKIELENKKLRHEILVNQTILKKDFNEKLKVLSSSFKEKEDLTKENLKKLLREFKLFIDKLNKKIVRETEKNKFLRKKYLSLYNLAERLDKENKKLKFVLLKKDLFLKQNLNKNLKYLDKTIKNKQKIIETRHKSLLKQHEEIKLELNKRLTVEKNKNELLSKKYENLLMRLKEIQKDNLKLQKFNKKILQRLAL
jgi:hypothetical protein